MGEECAHDCVYCGESLGSIIRAEVRQVLQDQRAYQSKRARKKKEVKTDESS